MNESTLQLIWTAGLGLGFLVSAAMLIVAIFSQSGRIEISPQRQAALATGHTDRRTVFENAALSPIMWLLLVIAHRLAMPRAKEWLRAKLVASGNPELYTPEEYLAYSMLVGLVLATASGLLFLVAQGGVSLTLPLMAGVVGFGASIIALANRASKRIRLIAKRVPYSLDLIALAMGAGATFTEAVSTVVRRGGADEEEPFNVELRAMLAEIELGTTRRVALKNLSDRVPLEMLQTIVASVIQAEDLGTPLSTVLHSQATLLRMQRSVRAENAAAVASVRILLPSLLILISVVLAIFAPAIIRIVRNGFM
ncbi:MAG: type II secretion system F family protein [Planctomycetaceae bacterium]|nr:type II secretion system F family protein [Planctomycetaceae bacterium]